MGLQANNTLAYEHRQRPFGAILGTRADGRTVLRYGCYFSTQARISFVLQIIHSSKTQDLYCVDFPKELRENLERHFRSDIGLAQDPMFANVLMLEYVLRSCQNKITDWRKKLRVIVSLRKTSLVKLKDS
ncbi:hypothetical protein PG988_007751 [Apiospora saccharicola]